MRELRVWHALVWWLTGSTLRADYPAFPARWYNFASSTDEPRECPRCGETVAPHWRHYMSPCRTCMPLFLCALPTRPDCPACDGTGFQRCEPQDLSVLRMSGVCSCGRPSASLYGLDGLIEGSEHHIDGSEADHQVTVNAQPLVEALARTLDEGIR